MTTLTKKCAKCGNEFSKTPVTSLKVWNSTKRFCSLSCSNGSRIAWNRGLPMTWTPARMKGKTPWNKGVPSPFVEELSPIWKGDKVGYFGMHKLVANWKGTPKCCEKCGRKDLPKNNYHWATVDHKYRRVLDDYIRLCVKCHSEFDRDKKHK